MRKGSIQNNGVRYKANFTLGNNISSFYDSALN